MPFDEYLFNFNASSFVSGPWWATDIDRVVTCPATFALKKILGAESAGSQDFQRSEKVAIGTRVHTWLRRALGGAPEFAAFEYSEEAKRALKAAAEETEKDLEARFQQEGVALPLWWKSALRKAVFNAWRCLPPLAAMAPRRFFAMEYPIRREIETESGPLKIEGRIDLVFSDHPGIENSPVEIIDFKTGKAAPPTMSHLDRGKGFQFAAYFLMAKAAGASSARVEMIRPGQPLAGVFNDTHEAELKRKMAALARVQRNRDFGQLGSLVAQWGPCESLPMATSPINPRVLERKAALRAET